MINAMTFEKRPIQVEAVWFMGESVGEDIVEWIRENSLTPTNVTFHKHVEETEDQKALDTRIYIHTLEGIMQADAGDWIIKGIKGEFYPCKPDVFEATYVQITFPTMFDEVV